MEPPPFQESSRCDVCYCSFTTFRRRHHCRCCGRTLCAEHSSNQMALPQFGLYTPVRVCADCFNNSSRLSKDDAPAVSNGSSIVTDSISRLDINSDIGNKIEEPVKATSVRVIPECKCGMPLCICEAPAAPKDNVNSLMTKSAATVMVRSNPKPKKVETPRSRGSTSNSKPGTVFNSGQATNDNLEMDYEASGEGMREAIKNGDTAAVKKLLNQGVDANFCDKQGLSLLHLAAVFNKTDIAFALMDHGANVHFKNSQGETPLDCAPATLQYKMKMKIEESQR
ncbi:OLC1v1025584C3 [Oldenlandia corymbosa var. corymbosa]|uniref:OLC1v1025584C3 n=1 Tax=Oldenlandia corymbosa var. corymbosa TaxID=529605 RepID=A0AAV1C8I2_OLDCO|nr:OLC1v1025584C3 [Oldenlandia corymbosa var. corymbosa]